MIQPDHEFIGTAAQRPGWTNPGMMADLGRARNLDSPDGSLRVEQGPDGTYVTVPNQVATLAYDASTKIATVNFDFTLITDSFALRRNSTNDEAEFGIGDGYARQKSFIIDLSDVDDEGMIAFALAWEHEFRGKTLLYNPRASDALVLVADVDSAENITATSNYINGDIVSESIDIVDRGYSMSEIERFLYNFPLGYSTVSAPFSTICALRWDGDGIPRLAGHAGDVRAAVPFTKIPADSFSLEVVTEGTNRLTFHIGGLTENTVDLSDSGGGRVYLRWDDVELGNYTAMLGEGDPDPHSDPQILGITLYGPSIKHVAYYDIRGDAFGREGDANSDQIGYSDPGMDDIRGGPFLIPFMTGDWFGHVAARFDSGSGRVTSWKHDSSPDSNTLDLYDWSADSFYRIIYKEDGLQLVRLDGDGAIDPQPGSSNVTFEDTGGTNHTFKIYDNGLVRKL